MDSAIGQDVGPERARLRGISLPRDRQILAGAMVADLTMSTLDVESLDLSVGTA
ncbi:hypothetical protein ACGFK1_07390 [Mycobacterium sp. NPDC048908]|uniref:hypothetical protein n=1 Tax=Mycobacterium sp. NPDC048908 TaxID=3364292 RepID=UPI0037109189